MKLRSLATLLVILCALCILACGGLIPGGSNNIQSGALLNGVAFSTRNPTTFVAGHSYDVVLESFAATAEERGRTTTVRLTSRPGITVTPESISQTLPATGRILSSFRVTVPAGYTGTQLELNATRTTVFSTFSIVGIQSTVAKSTTGLQTSMSPATAATSVGATATSTFTISPIGGVNGNVQLSSLASGVSLSETSYALNDADKQITVTYPVPSTAAVGVPIYLPIRATCDGGTSISTLVVTPTAAQNNPSFTVSTNTSNVSVTSQQPGALIVTVNPVNGFTGNITLTMDLPAGVVASPALPTTVIISDTNVNQAYQLRYQGNGVPGGVVTITATSGGITRTATFSINDVS